MSGERVANISRIRSSRGDPLGTPARARRSDTYDDDAHTHTHITLSHTHGTITDAGNDVAPVPTDNSHREVSRRKTLLGLSSPVSPRRERDAV